MYYHILVAFLINILVDTYCKPYTTVKIGAIFCEDESDLDTFLTNAIKFANEKLLENYYIRLESVIRYPTHSDDSVILQQIGCELLEEGVIAVMGPSSKISSDIITSLCFYLGIPHILFDMQNEKVLEEKKQQSSMTINFYPDLMILSKALADIVHSYSWKTFTIIYETNEGLTSLQDILQLLPLNKEDITVFQANSPSDFSLILKSIKYSTQKRIIVDCSPQNIPKFLNTASEFNMTELIYSYIFTNLDAYVADISNQSHIKANSTGIRLNVGNIQEDSHIKQKTITRTLHDGLILLARALISLLKDYDYNIDFLKTDVSCKRLTNKWNFGELILKQMKSNTVKDDVEFLTKKINFNNYGERTTFELEVYDFRNKHGWLIWDPHGSVSKIKYQNESPGVVSQSTLKGNIIIVATRLGPPYLMEVEQKDGEILQGNARYRGFALDLLAALAKRIGFEFEMRVVEDGKHGTYNKEKKDWDGIIKELRDGRAHLGICDLTITHERKKAVEFTVPFMSLGVSILYYRVQPEPPNLFSFLDPFALEVWLYMATAYLLVSLLLFVMARFSKGEWTNPHPCNISPNELENIWSLSNTTWLSMGSIMTQGCDILPRSGSLRFITGMWWFFALMMMNSYTANLAAFLTQSQMTTTIEDVKDLPEQNKIKYGTMMGGSTYNFFKESNESLYSKMWNAMKNEKPSVFTNDNGEGVKRVLTSKGKYAFLMETTSLEYSIAQNCQLIQVGKKFSDKHYGIAMPMGVSYRSELNVEILKLTEEGFIKQLKNKWWNRTGPPCEKSHASSDSADLSIAEVGGVFLVLGVGIFTAFVLGIAEFLWNVQRIAVDEKITPLKAFKTELLFTIKFWINRKPVKRTTEKAS